MDQVAVPPAHDVVEPGHEAHDTGTGVSNTKLAMWLFLSSDCLFFGAFISAYLFYRGRPQPGPHPIDVYNIPFTSVTSFILLATALFGATFIGGQVFEFTEFVRQGVTLDRNLFGSTFFVLTGLHGAHVTAGIIWLVSLWGLAVQGRLTSRDSERVEIAGLYWHFVDVVWIVIFTVVYLIPK